MSEIFEDMISHGPMGKTLFGTSTGAYRAAPCGEHRLCRGQRPVPYPYPVKDSIRHEVFSRRGGIWFGTRHLFWLPADYP